MTNIRRVELTKVFDIISPLADDRINFTSSKTRKKDFFPFVGRSSLNNGWTCFVAERKGFLNKGGVLTIALDGSTGSTFYQDEDFYCGQNIWILRPKKFKMSKNMGIWFSTLISKTVEDYTYNLSLTKNRLEKIKISIPFLNDEIDLDYIKTQSSLINKEKQTVSDISLPNKKGYKKFKITDLFGNSIRINSGIALNKLSKVITKYKMNQNDIAYFSAAKKNHVYGISGWISEDVIIKIIPKNIYEGNYILINNNGSIGYTRFFKGRFIGTSDVTIIPINFNNEKHYNSKELLIYLTASIQKYLDFKELNYNIKLKNTEIDNIEIFLPVKDDMPDYDKLISDLKSSNK